LPYKEVGKFIAKLRSMGSPPIAPKRDRVVHCAICESPHAQEIKAARDRGGSPENLGRRFGFPSGSMAVHLQQHVGRPFIRSLQACALELLILTAGVRREQATGARWDEIDYVNKKEWDCSKHKTRSKVKTSHIVLLNEQAISLLKEMKEWQKISGIETKFVFDRGVKGHAAGRPLGPDSVTKFMERVMKIDPKDATVHGFRRTFRSWAKDHGYDPHAAAMASGHDLGSQISRLYTQDAQMIDIQRPMYEAWGAYCNRPEPLPADVIPINRPKQVTA
jgi:hypothetical protein